MEIVTPSMYANIFSKNAYSHNIDIDDEKITDHVLDEKISALTTMQNQTSNSVLTLSENTNRAISAIKDKNETLLGEILQETQKLRLEIEKLKESVYKDELTNTFNRKWLQDVLLDESKNCFRNSGALAMIDLNYFKIVNDTYGHIIGDKVLIFIANQLRVTKESVVRYGGDEFMVIFSENVSKEGAINQLNELREDIITKHLKAKESLFVVSFSFGVEEFKINDKLSTIIELADKNMYDDKIKIKERITGI
ncbi:MAG: GGDEF domain-containing protein [Campylobacterales bacterium]|nr:GGDEF domain-containing protein [Campylobacterales bacterium]